MRDSRNLGNLYEPPTVTFKIDSKVCRFRGVGMHWGFGVSSCDDRRCDRYSNDQFCWSDPMWMMNSLDGASWGGWLRGG